MQTTRGAKAHTNPRTRWVATAVAVAVCGALGIGPAHAEDPTEATADLIADVAPHQGQVVGGAVVGDQIVATTSRTEVSVPVDPDQPIVLDGPAGSHAVAINLPTEVTAADAQVADDGTVVYHAASDGASAAVQVLADGSTRLQTITPDADGPHEFTYTFGDGIVPVVNADGTVALVQQTGGITVTLGSIGKAWAVDAKGRTVETSYQVRDGALVQSIIPTTRTVYPVVADPSVSIGWRIYVKYNKSEVKRTATSSLSNKLKYQAIICGIVPNPVVALACGLVAYDTVNSIVATVNSAYKAGKCVQVEYSLYGGIPLSWKAVKC